MDKTTIKLAEYHRKEALNIFNEMEKHPLIGGKELRRKWLNEFAYHFKAMLAYRTGIATMAPE